MSALIFLTFSWFFFLCSNLLSHSSLPIFLRIWYLTYFEMAKCGEVEVRTEDEDTKTRMGWYKSNHVLAVTTPPPPPLHWSWRQLDIFLMPSPCPGMGKMTTLITLLILVEIQCQVLIAMLILGIVVTMCLLLSTSWLLVYSSPTRAWTKVHPKVRNHREGPY